ncbi:MAG: NAD(P)/FAD-dependent oxidoreductase [Alphaproteobacteria bacterium]
MTGKKKIVIIGAGFAGLTAAKALKHTDADVFLIDRRNYHLFQPLLYQVATAALSPAQIAQPVRSILRNQRNCTTVLGEVEAIDLAARTVKGKQGELQYDYLIVATGTGNNYFGHDEWEAAAPGLKSIEDATGLRQRILSAFEQAEITADADERKAWMTFVVVGAGPTGVEMAGAIAELAKDTLKKDFRNIDVAKTRVLLVDAGKSVLASFAPKLSKEAVRDLEELGVEILLEKTVSACAAEGATIAGEFIPARTIVWAASIKASPAAQWLGAEKDRAGRVVVNPDLTLPAHDNVFVIGDTASVKAQDGKVVPGLAPAAMQQGDYVAKVIKAKLAGKPAAAPFVYKDYGTMATIGRGRAIVDLHFMSFNGYFAWWLWGIIHILPLISFRNRLIVSLEWLFAYVTNQRSARLITVTKDAEKDI